MDGHETANYAFISQSIHQKVIPYQSALRELSQKGFITVPVILPCPINNFNKEHKEQYRRNVSSVYEYLREVSPNVLDLSEVIKNNKHFTDSEHLAEQGRVVVGKKIQGFLKSLLPEIWSGDQSVIHCVNTDCLFGVKIRDTLSDEVLSKISLASKWTLAPLNIYGALSRFRNDYFVKNLVRTFGNIQGTEEGTYKGLQILQANRGKLNTGLKISMAELLEKTGETEKALAIYKSIASSWLVSKASRKEALMRILSSYCRSGRKKRALVTCMRLSVLFPNDGEVLLTISRAFAELQEYPSFSDAIEQVLSSKEEFNVKFEAFKIAFSMRSSLSPEKWKWILTSLSREAETSYAKQKNFISWIDQTSEQPFSNDGSIGAIIVNCNPFTYGHEYLVEQSLQYVKNLYIFVVETNRSDFSFHDRFNMVKGGTKKYGDRIRVLPSGNYIISQLTFNGYFTKSSATTLPDPILDVFLFGALISPRLGITTRLVGNEPTCLVTNAYNKMMKDLLPQFGLIVVEIQRKEIDGVAISASLVREFLREGKKEDLKSIVPQTTYSYIIENHIEIDQ